MLTKTNAEKGTQQITKHFPFLKQGHNAYNYC